MALRVCEIVSIVLVALVTGVFWGPWLGLSRSITTFEPQTFLAIGQRMIRNLAPVMPVLMPLSMFSIVLVLFFSWGHRSFTFSLAASALVCFIVALLVTLIVEVPIDNRIREWTSDTLPRNWQQLRDRWERFHAIRTTISVMGLILLVVGSIL